MTNIPILSQERVFFLSFLLSISRFFSSPNILKFFDRKNMTEITTIDNQNSLEIAQIHYENMTAFVQQQMKKGTDYGIIPG